MHLLFCCFADVVAAVGDVAPLITASDLQYTPILLPENSKIVCLEQSVRELRIGYPLCRLNPLADGLLREQ